MEIVFYGGVKRVTGSLYLLKIKDDFNILIDCGLIQGSKDIEFENFTPFPFNPKKITTILITHAHLDHIGRLPKIVREGFNGRIISTLPTKDLSIEILNDALKVIEEELGRQLYNKEDIEKTVSIWETIQYHEKIRIDNLEIEFFDAGHILGSSFIKINSEDKNIIFSGDLGNMPNPILKKLEDLPAVNYLVLESTYGDRNHEDKEKRLDLLEDTIEEVSKQKGVLIIPAFAVERTQEILFDIEYLIENSKIPFIPIYIDSPLAQNVTKIYRKYVEYFNDEAKERLLFRGVFSAPNINWIYDEKDEIKLFTSPNPKIIIGGAGMITGGRILNILRKFIEKENTTILFVGFQAEGTLGRKIFDGEKEIEINGEKLKINAKITKILSYSDHIDQKNLINWITTQKKNLKTIFLVHGDEKSKITLKNKIIDELAIPVEIPTEGEIFEI